MKNSNISNILFPSTLMAVNWTPMYTMSTCKEHFEFPDNVMQDLLDTFFPFKESKVYPSDNRQI